MAERAATCLGNLEPAGKMVLKACKEMLEKRRPHWARSLRRATRLPTAALVWPGNPGRAAAAAVRALEALVALARLEAPAAWEAAAATPVLAAQVGAHR